MLSQDEQVQVVDLLLLYVAPQQSPRAAICVEMSKEFAETLSITLTNPRAVVVESLRLCMADEYRSNPPWIVSLLEIVGTLAPVPRLLERLRNPPPKLHDPLDAVLLATDMPFVNRSRLRERLRVLNSKAARKRILVVTGPRRSGKSYSRELIDHFCGGGGSLLHSHVPLQAGQEGSTGIREVALDLVAPMGRPTEGLPLPLTNEDRWAREVATWVLLQAVSTPHDWWLVLDGFNHPDLRTDTRKLITHLADQVTNGVFAQRCRLILLDFDRTSLSVAPGSILVEQVDPNLDGEVEACVEAILQRTGQHADAAQVTTAIVQNLPTGDERLPALNQKLKDLLEAAEEIDD